MKVQYQCYSCFTKQITSLIEKLFIDEKTKREALKEMLYILSNQTMELSPPEIAASFYSYLKNNHGIEDPFSEEKSQSNKLVISLLPRLRKMIANSPAPLDLALNLSALGNVIDFGVPNHFDVEFLLNNISNIKFAIDDREELKNKIKQASSLLIIGDNAGETGFDLVLMEEIRKQWRGELHYLVRGAPVLNDATLEDAIQLGLDKIATIHQNGVAIPGTPYLKLPTPIKNLFANVEIIISKGQGNFETLSDVEREIFFIMTVKCEAVAEVLKAPIGAEIIKYKKCK